MRLTDAQIRCLLALLSLTRLGGAIASKDVSKVLGVSRPSVHRMLENLGNSGLTEKKPYGAVKLTEQGCIWRRNWRRGATGYCCSLPAASAFPWMRARWRRRCF